MKAWWARQSPERKRAILDGRKHKSGTPPTKRRDPEKIQAQRLMWKAIYKGELVKTPCEVCGEPKVDGHHEDYSKPLEVTWLCRKHHMERHRVYAF